MNFDSRTIDAALEVIEKFRATAKTQYNHFNKAKKHRLTVARGHPDGLHNWMHCEIWEEVEIQLRQAHSAVQELRKDAVDNRVLQKSADDSEALGKFLKEYFPDAHKTHIEGAGKGSGEVARTLLSAALEMAKKKEKAGK